MDYKTRFTQSQQPIPQPYFDSGEVVSRFSIIAYKTQRIEDRELMEEVQKLIASTGSIDKAKKAIIATNKLYNSLSKANI